ncbi:hypothetical protein NMY22_g12000 [Coprinellus aureogranulatus]|nr:hypothetical protein NMY22_g12000 [Coprinellus aureogranulatus]
MPDSSAAPVVPANDKENVPPGKSVTFQGKRAADPNSGLTWAPPKKQCRTDPLVGHGKHFGRTIRTFCHIQTIISQGLSRTMHLELGRISEADLSYAPRDIAGQRLYRRLLALSPGLEERLNLGSEDEVHYIANMITKGISQARSDDTKSLKSAVIDWITPPNEVLRPPLPRNAKHGRGFHHERTGFLLCPVSLNWDDPSKFLFAEYRLRHVSWTHVPFKDSPRSRWNYEYNKEDVWDGLLRSSLLAYKHVFTSPSSVDAAVGVVTSTRSCNARIHGMTSVTIASIAYIATQVRFALLSSNVFCQADKKTDSEGFYSLMIDLLEDEEEKVEVASLLKWWNHQIFPPLVSHTRLVHSDSVIAKVKERRRLIKEGLWRPSSTSYAQVDAANTSNATSETPA